MAQIEPSEGKMKSSRRKVLGIDLRFLKEWWKKKRQSREESRTSESEAPKMLRFKWMKRRGQKRVLKERELRVSVRAQDLGLQELELRRQEMQVQWQEPAVLYQEEYAEARESIQDAERQKLIEQKQRIRYLMQELSERELRVEEREQRIGMKEREIVEREKEIESRQRTVEERVEIAKTQPRWWSRRLTLDLMGAGASASESRNPSVGIIEQPAETKTLLQKAYSLYAYYAKLP